MGKIENILDPTYDDSVFITLFLSQGLSLSHDQALFPPKSINSVCWNNTEAEGWGSSLPFRPLRLPGRGGIPWGVLIRIYSTCHFGAALSLTTWPSWCSIAWLSVSGLTEKGCEHWEPHPLGAPWHIRGSGFCFACTFSNFCCVFHLEGVGRRAVELSIRRLSCSS